MNRYLNQLAFGPIFVGAIVTFVMSRILFWVMSKWDGGVAKLAIAHGASFAICWSVDAYFTAYYGGGMMNWSDGAIYAVPQIFWFGFDIMRGTGDSDLRG